MVSSFVYDYFLMWWLQDLFLFMFCVFEFIVKNVLVKDNNVFYNFVF